LGFIHYEDEDGGTEGTENAEYDRQPKGRRR
jgi:hypothetical protein